MSEEYKSWMARAIQLAARGRGAVEPNPMVGAIIVADGEILAEGYHAQFGGPHAEVQALDAARKSGRDVRGATMVVTLEPCSHQGKTPPCVEALIEAGIARVVVAIEDPDEKVSGRGLTGLRDAGIDVVVGPGGAEARELLAPYIKLRTQKRPWVIAKWAQTADGYLALPPGRGRWISCPESRQEVHQLRAVCDGILVGVETLLADDPLLTNRSEPAGAAGTKILTRVVLDSRLRTPTDAQLIQTSHQAPVILATTRQAIENSPPTALKTFRDAGVELLPLPADENGLSLPDLLDELGRRNWMNLLIEGGPAVLRNFLTQHLADEAVVFLSPQTARDPNQSSDPLAPPPGLLDLLAENNYAQTQSTPIGTDQRLRFRLCT